MGFFGRSKGEKELSETTGGGFERSNTVGSFVKPTAESVMERVKGGLERIGEEQQEFKKAKLKHAKTRAKAMAKKGFSLELSPALKTSKAPKQKKSQLEKMLGI